MSKLVIAADSHQDIFYLSKILDRELSDCDKVIFLGDHYDYFNPKATIKETCEFLNKVKLELKDKLINLYGNHCCCYLFHYERAKLFKKIEPFNHFYCTGFTKSKAYDVGKYLSKEFIKETKFVHFEDGVLYSHAGARPELFKYINGQFDVAGFVREADRLNETWKLEPLHPFLQIGHCRGGRSEFGGLTWADWRSEHHVYSLELPTQVFGHSSVYQPRKLGNNHCIDARQTWYAIVSDGNVEYKTV